MLTEPETVSMTPQQHDQAVTALATMIGDWLGTRPAAPKPTRPGDVYPQPAAQDDGNQRERT